MERRYSNRAVFVYAAPLRFSLTNLYRRLSSVARAQQRRRDRPGATDQPSLYGHRKVTAHRSLSENARENGTVTAHCACDIERRRPRLALMTMRSSEHRTRLGRIVGMRMQPDHGQIAALMGRFGSGARLLPAGRADPRRSRRRRRDYSHRAHRISRHPRRRFPLVQVSVDSSAGNIQHRRDLCHRLLPRVVKLLGEHDLIAREFRRTAAGTAPGARCGQPVTGVGNYLYDGRSDSPLQLGNRNIRRHRCGELHG